VWNFSEGDSLEIAKEINVVLSLKLETELETEEKANNQKENDKKDNQPDKRTKGGGRFAQWAQSVKKEKQRKRQQEIVCKDDKCRYCKFDRRKGGTHAHAKLSIANGAVGFASLKIGPYRDGKKPPSSLRRKGPNIVLGVEQTQKKLTFTGGLDSDVPIELARIAEAQIEQRFQPQHPGAEKVPLKHLNDRVYAVVLDDDKVNQGKTCSFIRESNMHEKWWAATLSRPLYLLKYFLMKIKKTKFKTTLKLDCNIAGIF
jgi:hypothetical protein